MRDEPMDIVPLLENFWIRKDTDKELYYQYKNMDRETKDFIREKLGYNLVVNQYLVKLEKVPETPEAWMGIPDFREPMDYVFLCLLLSFLEDKNRDEQFLLSHITEYFKLTYPDGDIDWTLYHQRKSLVRVLNFAIGMGFIQVDDGNHELFSESYETEVLYESTGLSRYFIRNLAREMTAFHRAEDVLEGEWLSGDESKGIIRRMRVYRALFLNTGVYRDDDALFLYIRNFRSTIQSDLEAYMGASLHLYKTCAYGVVEDNRFRHTFPEDSNLCDVALLFLDRLLDGVADGRLKLRADDTVWLDEETFDDMLADCMECHGEWWNKEFREKKPGVLKKDLVEYFQWNNMLRLQDGEYCFLPLALRFRGTYGGDEALEDVVNE